MNERNPYEEEEWGNDFPEGFPFDDDDYFVDDDSDWDDIDEVDDYERYEGDRDF